MVKFAFLAVGLINSSQNLILSRCAAANLDIMISEQLKNQCRVFYEEVLGMKSDQLEAVKLKITVNDKLASWLSVVEKNSGKESNEDLEGCEICNQGVWQKVQRGNVQC